MPFEIEIINESQPVRFLLKEPQTDTVVEIVPELGAMINHFKCGNHIIIQGNDPSSLSKKHKRKYAFRMAPYTNRIRDGLYAFEGESFQLDIKETERNNAIHGFARDAVFDPIGRIADPHNAVLETAWKYVGDEAGYPFPFDTEIRFTLAPGCRLEVSTKVTNAGKSTMPYGEGWHPYFFGQNRLEDLRIQMSVAERIIVDDRMLPTGKKQNDERFETPCTLEGQELDDAFVLRDPQIQLIDEIGERKIIIDALPDHISYNYAQLYIPDDRETVAIEPMTCPPDALNSGEGLHYIKPGESLNFGFSIQMQPL